MNFIEKLESLMKKEGLNNNTLAKKSGVPYTTIDALFKKGYEGVRMSTVKKLAAFFHVSLDYLMDDTVSDPNYGKADTDLLADMIGSEAKKLHLIAAEHDVSAESLRKQLQEYYCELLSNNLENHNSDEQAFAELSTLISNLVIDEYLNQQTIDEENEAKYHEEREQELVGHFRKLNDEGQNFAIDFLEALSHMKKYKP